MPSERICARLEDAGLRIAAARMLRLSREQAAAFYAVHQGKPFFADLVDFMVRGRSWPWCWKARTP